MTREQLREAAAVMLAAAERKPVQMFRADKNEWFDLEPPVMFVGNIWEYRIKPEPRKVKVRIFRDPHSNNIAAIEQEFWKYHQHWKTVSDIVEIEVKE